MAKVPRLNKTILPVLSDPANIARQADPGAFQAAGGLARGIAGITAVGVDVAQSFKAAKDASFLSEKSTALERDVDTFFRDFQTTAASDPDAMRPEFDKFIGKRFEELSKGGSNTAMGEFTRFRDDIKFKYDRKYDDFAQRQNVSNATTGYDNTISDTALLAFRAGQDGSPLDEFLNNVDMASLAATTFISAPDLANLNAEAKSRVAEDWAQGRIENNPLLFKEELDDGKLDDILSADQIQSLGKQALDRFDKAEENTLRDSTIDFATGNNEAYERFLQKTLTLPELTNIEASIGQTPFTKMAREKLTVAKNKQPKVPIVEQLKRFQELQIDLVSIRQEIGDEPEISTEVMQLYVEYQNKIYDSISSGHISEAEGKAFNGEFSKDILQGLIDNRSDKEGFIVGTRNGVQAPYQIALGSIDSFLAKTGRENDLAAKKEMTIRFSQFLGEYESTGDREKDIEKIQKALVQTTRSFVEDESPGLRLLPGKPNGIISARGKQAISGEKSDLKPDATVRREGQLMEDANGNLAIVFPNGSVEELTREEAKKRGLI